jgi:hypothetical protein
MKLDEATWARIFPWLDKAQDVPGGAGSTSATL